MFFKVFFKKVFFHFSQHFISAISLDCGCKSTAIKHIFQMFLLLFFEKIYTPLLSNSIPDTYKLKKIEVRLNALPLHLYYIYVRAIPLFLYLILLNLGQTFLYFTDTSSITGMRTHKFRHGS